MARPTGPLAITLGSRAGPRDPGRGPDPTTYLATTHSASVLLALLSFDTIPTVAPAKNTHAATLAKVPIFSGLEEHELDFLVQRTIPRQYSPGEIIFHEGQPCVGLFVVESGHVRIYKSSASGREQVLSIDGPGSSVAELPVFDGGNYPASCAAVDDSTLL